MKKTRAPTTPRALAATNNHAAKTQVYTACKRNLHNQPHHVQIYRGVYLDQKQLPEEQTSTKNNQERDEHGPDIHFTNTNPNHQARSIGKHKPSTEVLVCKPVAIKWNHKRAATQEPISAWREGQREDAPDPRVRIRTRGGNKIWIDFRGCTISKGADKLVRGLPARVC